jgi:hypothetical protein
MLQLCYGDTFVRLRSGEAKVISRQIAQKVPYPIRDRSRK